jgi:hypothetical protein
VTQENIQKDQERKNYDLQEQLLRYNGRFTSAMTMAFRPLVQAEDPSIRMQAMIDELAYVSASLDIAVGPSPELDLVDMITLVALGKDAMTASWRTQTTADHVGRIEEAFEAALEDVRAIGRTMLSPELEDELFRIIREWRESHPKERDVVAVRLSENTEPEFAGSVSLARQADVLFSRLRRVTHTADDARALGRRALFAGQRLPFLLRMHAEIATTDAVLTVRRTMADATRESMPALAQTVTSMSDKLLLKAGLMGSAVAIVAAGAWLLARLAYSRLR